MDFYCRIYFGKNIFGQRHLFLPGKQAGPRTDK
jgi:hypothetical protein